MDWINQVHYDECRETMRRMIADGVKVQMCVTSPPYWGLRQYLFDNAVQLRNNLTPEEQRYVLKELEKHGIKPHT